MPGPCTPPPVTPVTAVAGAQAEMVAVLANMAESALAAGPAPATEVSGGDPRRAEGDRRAPDRAAVVYVRQPALVQVREHTESTLRQYDLAAQAARLGWAGTAIEIRTAS